MRSFTNKFSGHFLCEAGGHGLGAAFTADADISADDTLMNNVSAERMFEFAPAVARYIRVRGNTVGNGVLRGYTALGEVKMFAMNYSDAHGRPYGVLRRICTAPAL